MGFGIPQVLCATESGASGAQVIDGSLKFMSTTNSHLRKSISSAGNRQTWTLSFWIKNPQNSSTENRPLFTYGSGSSGNYVDVRFTTSGVFQMSDWTTYYIQTSALYRDQSAWYHFVVAVDTTIASPSSDRVKLYVNGVRTTKGGSDPSQNYNFGVNNNQLHVIGASTDASGGNVGGSNLNLTGYNFIDGVALGPENFGFTDPLTNTWRPKKFVRRTINDGTVWSDNATATGTTVGPGTLASLFDGDLTASSTGYISAYQSGTRTLTVTFDPPLPGGTKVEIFAWKNSTNSSGVIEINGTDVSSLVDNNYSSGTDNIADVTSAASGGIQTIKLYRQDGVKNPAVSGIRVDGIILRNIATTNLGTNDFYLPMDGNSPIGQDKSGNGNDWTPENFGGSVALDNPQVSGARPILNTSPGGTQAGVGVFGSKEGFHETVSSSSGGGNPYIFDTRGTQPTLSFIRGATYVFDYSSATSHPLRFATAADAAGSTQYTDGTSVSGNVISFTVPHNAPDTLYYYCTNHSGMGNSISVTTDTTKADPYAWKCTLALPLVSSKDDVSNEINVNSTTKVMTTIGNAAAANEESNFYSGSFEFDGSSDGLSTPTSSELEFGNNDFTIECWVKQDSSSSYRVFVAKYTGSGNGGFYMGQNGQSPVFINSGGTLFTATNFKSSTDEWYHMAVCREGSTTNMYINGVCEATGNTSDASTTTHKVTIGVEDDGSSSSFDGYLQDVRIYQGVSKYSGATVGTQYFTVPSTSPDILPDTPSGVSANSKLTKITEGALSIPDNNSRLTLADSDDAFNLGSGDWTIEAFVYLHNVGGGNNVLFFQGYTSDYLTSQNRMIVTYITTGGVINIAQSTTGTDNYDEGYGNTPLGDNRWYHLAYVRNGSNLDVYVDGKKGTTRTARNLNNSSAVFCIGSSTDNVDGFNGFISNFRLVKGTAVYTANFTPPKAPLTNVTNTKLLCCQSNTSAIEGAVKPGTITAVSSAAATNFNPFTTDINTVRGQETGYPTWNPLCKGSSVTLSNGNLTATKSGSGYYSVVTTMTTPTFGKWYYEVESNVSGNNLVIGIAREDFNQGSTLVRFLDHDPLGYIYRATDGYKSNNNSDSSYGDSYTAGDVVGVGLDLDAGTLTFYKNGVSQGVAFSSLSGRYYFGLAIQNAYEATANFGQKPFKFAPPEGFQPLNVVNTRPVKVISRPDQYVGVVTYSGNSAANDIRVGFAPDMIWLKSRTNNVYGPISDTVRGANYFLAPSLTDAQRGPGYNNDIVSFDKYGFTLGADSYYAVCNQTSQNYVGWTWKAGGNKNTYNIDDVGYASAASAQMSVGALNSAVYDQSQRWRDNITSSNGWNASYPVTNIFNGSFDGGGGAANNGGGGTITFTPPSSITVTKLEISTYTDVTLTLPDGTTQLLSGVGSADKDVEAFIGSGFSFTGSNSISISRASGFVYLERIKINGKELVDDDVTVTNVPSIAPVGCSVGTKQGFSVVQYQGNSSTNQSIPHGLTQRPDFSIIKNMDGSANWTVFHRSVITDSQKVLYLNTTGAIATYSGGNSTWWYRLPQERVFFIGATGTAINNGTNDMISYHWHNVPGLQKFGSYEGNASADGPYIELGFRPAVIMVKNVDNADDWVIADTARSPFNPQDETLFPNSGTAEDTGTFNIDILSNGFKVRHSSGKWNSSGHTFAYAAWAEVPSTNLYGAQSNAR